MTEEKKILDKNELDEKQLDEVSGGSNVDMPVQGVSMADGMPYCLLRNKN